MNKILSVLGILAFIIFLFHDVSFDTIMSGFVESMIIIAVGSVIFFMISKMEKNK